ncbi:MAG: serine hydrolase [Pirellulales bacterium]
MLLGVAVAPVAVVAADDQLAENELRSQIDATFQDYDRWDRPGIALAVVKDGALFYARGYGSANLEYDVPITPATVFHVASVSKQFTCFAVLLLAADGKLSLDDDVRKHVPDVPDFGTPITLRQLMHHTSGLRDQWALLAMAGWRLDDVITREHILKLVRRQRELNFPPGTEHLYCNTGYTLLAEVVANVSGKSFRAYCDERIFKPLGMTHTHFHDDHEELVPNRAYSYSKHGDTYRASVLSYANVGATSLFTTAEDLARWLVNLDDGRVGGATLAEQMQTKGVLTGSKEIDYALGLTVKPLGQVTAVGHSGSDAGYRTHVVRFPEARLGIIVLGNFASCDAGGDAMKVARIMLGDRLDSPDKNSDKKPDAPPQTASADKPATDKPADAKPAEGADKPKTEADEPKTQPVDVPLATLQKYVGLYKMSTGGTVEIELRENKLTAKIIDDDMELVPVSPTEFLIKQVEARVTFPSTEAEHADAFTAVVGGAKLEGTRVSTTEAIDLAPFAGRYTSPELETSYDIVVDGDHLVARHQRHEDIRLTHTTGDEFAGSTWFIQGLKFQRCADGKITGLVASNGRVRNLKFDRAAE